MRASQTSFILRMAVSALAVMTLSAQETQECDVECEVQRNNTQLEAGKPKCIKQEADFSEHTLPGGEVLPFHDVKNSPKGYHCVCNENWTGLACRRKFESCEEEGADHKCYHSGECQEGLVDSFGNKKLFCDCSGAQDHNETKMIGKYCTQPVVRCTNDALGPSSLFCLNEGECRTGDDLTHANPCKCKDGFHGPHCEFTAPIDADDCDMRCKHSGICRPGFKDFHQATLMFKQDGFFDEDDYQHCQCPDSTEGVYCEHKLTIDGERICGEKARFPCQNGGKCVEFKNETTGEVTEGCDCSDAKNSTHFFGGKFCEHVSTSFCSLNIDQNGNQFCVNGGTCREGGTHLGCDCPAGFTGDICDIVLTGNQDEDNTAIEEEATCELDCGDGDCRKGVKDLSLLEGFGSELAHIANETNKNFQHCVCPPGLVGPRCEFKVEICGEGQHLCLHGSKCVDVGDKQACDCDHAFNSLTQFAGAFCQHEASEFCTEDGKPGAGGKASKAFCVNKGKCKGTIKDGDKEAEHPGCDCEEGFEGDHCEFKIGSPFNPSTKSSSGDDSGGLSTGGKVAVSLTAVALVAAFSFFVWQKTHQGKAMDTARGIETAAPAPTSGPVLNMGPDKDADGNEVTDVEIL